jgi:hypothetical protein
MMSTALLLHLGDLALTAALALAIAAWLGAARGRRAAFAWLLAFAAAIALVGIDKIAYLGWGLGLPTLGFKALSGHATGAMAIYPMLCHLLAGRRWPRLATLPGVLAGLAVTFLLVLHGEHTAAEALAGCLLGAAVSTAGVRLAGAAPPPPRTPVLACSMLLLAAAAALLGSAPVGYWMIKAARVLSGNARPYALASWIRD